MSFSEKNNGNADHHAKIAGNIYNKMISQIGKHIPGDSITNSDFEVIFAHLMRLYDTQVLQRTDIIERREMALLSMYRALTAAFAPSTDPDKLREACNEICAEWEEFQKRQEA